MPAQPPGTEVEVGAVPLPELEELDDEELTEPELVHSVPPAGVYVQLPLEVTLPLPLTLVLTQLVEPLDSVRHFPVGFVIDGTDPSKELEEADAEHVSPPLLVGRHPLYIPWVGGCFAASGASASFQIVSVTRA
jgi:hypothetical protein